MLLTADGSGPGPVSHLAELVLTPVADVYVRPGQLLVHTETGLRLFADDFAENAARALSDGGMVAEKLFRALSERFGPMETLQGLNRLKDAGIVVTKVDGAREICPQDLPTLCRLMKLAALDGLQMPSGELIPVEVNAQRVTVGPRIGGADGPCLACLAGMASAHDDLGRLLAKMPFAHVSRLAFPPMQIDAIRAFAREAATALQDLPSGTILGRMQADQPRFSSFAQGRGGCRACDAAPAGLSMPDQASKLRSGGYRPRPAEDLLKELSPFIDPISGIIRDLQPLPRAQAVADLNHAVLARHAFPLAAPDARATLRNRQGRSAGKGRTRADAHVSAIAEAFERYAGCARSGDVHAVARAEDLEGHVITPGAWTLYSDAQFEAAADWQALEDPAAHVPERGDDALAWTRIRNEMTGATGWAPSALCWHQFDGAGAGFQADSNGCAAGQTPLDALLQGLFELIERDAVSIWWWNRIERPMLDVARLEDPFVSRVAAAMAQLGYPLRLFDLTHDLRVPVVAATAWPESGRGPLLLGFGAHLSPPIAVSRAVTEILQALPAEPAHQLHGTPWSHLGHVPGAPEPGAADFAFLRSGPPGDLDASEAPATADEALDYLKSRLDAQGLSLWSLDQSRLDVPLPVMRAIVPGLRHFRPRFAKGRLEAVPRSLGWCGQGPNPAFIPQ